ncbi:MAG: hypothetical protein GF411_00865 [Candidatus Lokiarchaeota archaeon]|nr:hypothetical protein [Candidatus Lokiarchaeota archaeon]
MMIERSRLLRSKSLKQTLVHLCREGLLVDIILRSFTHYDVPRKIRENIENVRILNVANDHIVVGPKKPISTAIITIEEIGLVLISKDRRREDEDEIDSLIEKECPDWQRDLTHSDTEDSEATDCIEVIEEDELTYYLENNQFVVLEIYAPWCQHCQEVEEILEELAPQYHNVSFLSIDGDIYEDICERFDITSYPTVILFKDGEVYGTITGAGNQDFYERYIDRMIGINPPIMVEKEADGTVHLMSGSDIFEKFQHLPLSVVMFFKRGDYECQLQSRAMNELAKEYKSKVYFAKVDIEKDKVTSELFDVEVTPEVYLLKGGDLIGYSPDRLTKTELRDAIEEALTMKQ